MTTWADYCGVGLATDQCDALQMLSGKRRRIPKPLNNRVLELRICVYQKFLKMSYFLADFAKYPAFFLKRHVVGTGINL
ncbi:hypothetical protein MCAMS1_01441 [biofilm metagenome]